MGLMEFLSLPGQERTRRRDEFLGGLLNYYLGPTGIPERLGVADMMNPFSDVGRAMTSSQEMLAPGRTPMERVGAGATMLADMASVAAPAAATRIAGGDATQGMVEGLLGMGAPTRQGLDDAAEQFVARMNQPGPVPTMYSNPLLGPVDAGPSGALTLGRSDPAPRNEAEAMARNILEMRAAGRAGDVTEEMRAAADPMYMYDNTPLPMDEASRMARAREMAFGGDWYHATGNDIQAFDDSPLSRRVRADEGVFLASKPSATDGYGDTLMPLTIKRAPSTLEVDLGNPREVFNMIPEDQRPWSGSFADYRETPGYGAGEITPRDDFADVFADYVNSGWDVQYSRVNDFAGDGRRGRHTILQVADPRNIRSRFALFDPEFRHLRNLSAGVGGLGLLATQMPEQQRDEEIRQYLGGLL